MIFSSPTPRREKASDQLKEIRREHNLFVGISQRKIVRGKI
jgi:hypothetical protein